MVKKAKRSSKATKRKNNINKKVSPEFYFRLIDGYEIKSLHDFAESLHEMSDDVFYYHVSEGRNDFSNWVRDILKEKKLADVIQKTNGKLETEIIVLRHIVDKLV